MRCSNAMSDWKLVILKLKQDCAAKEIIDVFQNIWSDGVIIKQKRRRSISKRGAVTASIKRAFNDLEGKILTLYSKGDYHHYTYGLCKVVADSRSKSYCYMHLDHHNDAIFYNYYDLGMAAFVQHIKKYTNASSVLLLGPPKSSFEALNYVTPGIDLVTEKELYDQKNFRKIISNQQEKDVYLSCDLDVLHREEFSANWSRGELKLDDAKTIIKTINEEKNVISADILGYNGSDIKSCLAYAVLAGTLMNKDIKEAEKLFKYLKENPNIEQEDALKIIKGLKL